MKKLMKLTAILMSLVLLLAACGQDTQPTAPQETGGIAESASQLQGDEKEPTEETFPTEPITYEIIQPEQGDFAISYPKNCNFNQYGDVGGVPLNVYIVSRRPIGQNKISVDAIGTDSETHHISDQRESLNYEMDAGTNLDYPNYLYQTQQGIDWQTAGQLFAKMRDAGNFENGAFDADTFYAGLQATEEYEAYASQYLEGYETEKESLYKNCPYYLYCGSINFKPGSEAETINTIRVEVEGQSYDLPIGEIRLYPSLSGQLGLPENSPSYAITSEWNYLQVTPWNTGRYKNYYYFTAGEDVTLKRLELVADNGSMIEEIKVVRSNASGQSADISWDGSTDLHLDKEDSVILRISMYDPNMAGLANYCTMDYFVLYYTTETSEAYATFGSGRYTDQSYFDWCAIYLDGLDLRSYYIYHENVRVAGLDW